MTGDNNPQAELETALDDARSDLKALQDEGREIGQRIAQAAQADEGAEPLIKAVERQDRLPTYIFAAEVKVRRCRIALLTARKEALLALVPPLRTTTKAARERVKAAQAELGLAARKESHTTSKARSLASQISQLERDLAGLVAAHAEAGTPVRSLVGRR